MIIIVIMIIVIIIIIIIIIIITIIIEEINSEVSDRDGITVSYKIMSNLQMYT